MDSILSMKDLYMYYGQKQILSCINMGIKRKIVTAIIGPSGCGKSTLLKTINRMVKEEEGSREYIEGIYG